MWLGMSRFCSPGAPHILQGDGAAPRPLEEIGAGKMGLTQPEGAKRLMVMG